MGLHYLYLSGKDYEITSMSIMILYVVRRLRLKCDGTRAETRFCLSAKRTSPFKSARASVQSKTGSRFVRFSGSNAGYTMFQGSVKGTGYPLHSAVSPSLPLPCVTVCHHVSTGLYKHIGIKITYDLTNRSGLGPVTFIRKLLVPLDLSNLST